jgi:hypothetical protein
MGLVAKDDGWRIPEALWAQMEPLLPAPKEHPASRAIFLSPRDAACFFVRAVEAELPPGGFHVVFVTSRGDTHQGLDLEPARKLLGYGPRDVYPDGLDFS